MSKHGSMMTGRGRSVAMVVLVMVVSFGAGMLVHSLRVASNRALALERMTPIAIDYAVPENWSPPVGYDGPPYFLPTPDRDQVKGEYWTNKKSSRPVVRQPIGVLHNSPIFYVSYLSYSREFADAHGFPDDYVEELTSGFEAVELRIHTVGHATMCIVNMLIDKSEKLRLPEKDYHYRQNIGLWNRLPMHFPKRPGGVTEPYAGPGERFGATGRTTTMMERIGVNVGQVAFMSTLPNYPNDKGPGFFKSLVVLDSSPDFFTDLKFLSVWSGCKTARRAIKNERGELWILRQLDEDEFAKASSDRYRSNFLILDFPPRLRRDALVTLSHPGVDSHYLDQANDIYRAMELAHMPLIGDSQ